MEKNIKKIISLLVLIIFVFTTIPTLNIVNAADITSPVLTITGPSASYIQDGGTVKYTLVYTDNVAVTNITIKPSDVVLVGFTATTSAVKNGSTVTINITNIHATNNGSKYIIVNAGTASDAQGNVANKAVSDVFKMPDMVIRDTTAPTISISNPSSSTVRKGGTVEYTVTYADNVGIKNITLNPSNITLNGFSANRNVSIISNTQAKVTLTNIQGNEGTKNISISSGTASDAAGNVAPSRNSNAFALVDEPEQNNNNNNNSNNSNNNGKNNNTGNGGKNTNNNGNKNDSNTGNSDQNQDNEPNVEIVPGIDFGYNVNTEIKNFASWLKSKKENISNVQEYNYLSEDEELTYFIDYYNGSAEEKTVNLKLNIPFKTNIKEISNGGNVIIQEDNSTIIEWNLESVKSQEKNRIFVKVKFGKDLELINSDNMSKIFYSELTTKIGDNTTSSYLRQIYIDKSITKTGTFADSLKFLTSNDNIRPNDEITRAELAKMIADAGIINIEYGSDKYKKYKDYKKIPVYSRDAISSLADTNVFNIEDNNFDPNYPIIRDDFMKIMINLLGYVSDSKIKAEQPIYIIDDLVKDSDSNVNENKNYIMELARLNILPEYKTTTKVDEYIKRKEALAIINSIAFKSTSNTEESNSSVRFLNINNIKYLYDFT